MSIAENERRNTPQTFFPHVITYHHERGKTTYWNISESTIDANTENLSIHLSNGMRYCFEIRYLLNMLSPSIHKEVSSGKRESKNRYRVRTLFRDTKGPGPYDLVRVYDLQSQVYYWFSAETVLMKGEAAYADFASERYSVDDSLDYCGEVVDGLTKNPVAARIVICPQTLKSKGFFCLSHLWWYPDSDIVLLISRGGDQYGIRAQEYPALRDFLFRTPARRFRHPVHEEPRPLLLSRENLTAEGAVFLDGCVLDMAFQLDYRFRGQSKNYWSDISWDVYPAAYIFSGEYIWPSQYDWIYDGGF